MEYIIGRIVRETVKFLELCQAKVIKGNISIDAYSILTNVKFDFIDNILEKEKRQIFIDESLIAKLNKLYKTDNLICSQLNNNTENMVVKEATLAS